MKKRFLASLLSAVMALSMLPASVFAENAWGGTGLAELQVYAGGLYAVGNNLVLRDGASGLTSVFYADASGAPVGTPVDLSQQGISGTVDSGFDLTAVELAATYHMKFNDESAFEALDVLLKMEGGTLPAIIAGSANAKAKSVVVYLSGGTLTGGASGSAIRANEIYVSGGRIEKDQSAQLPLYLSGSPRIGGDGCGITVAAGQTFYLNGALNGADVYVVPQSDFAGGTVLAESAGGYVIQESDLAQMHLTGSYAGNKELYLENNQIKIREKTTPPVTAYDVWVGGVPVTEENADDVLRDGTVSYDAGSGTLTLKGLTLTDQGVGTDVQGDAVFASIFSRGDLRVVLAEGSTNTISVTQAVENTRIIGIGAAAEDGAAGDVSISGSGTLSIVQSLSAETDYAVGVFGEAVSLRDACLDFSASGGRYGMGVGAGSLEIRNADVTCSGAAYGLVSTGDLSVLSGSHIKAAGSVGALYSATGTISVDSGLALMGSAVQNDFEQLTEAQVSSVGNSIVVGTAPALSVEIRSIPEVSYLDETGEPQTLTGAYTTVAPDTASWSGGWYVADGVVAIDSRVTVTGNVKLILKDGADLTVNGGIFVPEGSSLTVYGQQGGTGNLTSTGTNGNAGIGGSGTDVNFGTVVLAAGGRIVATGDVRAAGIGGGGRIHNNSPVDGTIHIYRGDVEAAGGSWAAGIGGGADSITNCRIVIDGGSIVARGGQDNVGIGGTEGSKEIVINDGDVKAYGNGAGAGIGGSYDASGGIITITGGAVDAGSIGGGSAGNGGAGGTIVISGGTVTAERIGAGGRNGEGTFSTTSSGDAVIFAGSITDQSGKNDWRGLVFEGGAGRIYGDAYTVKETLTIPAGNTLTIENGKTLTASDGAGIVNNGAIRVSDGGTYASGQPDGKKVAYQIDWDTDGDGDVDDTEYILYGELPEHADGEKAATDEFTYVFEGWNPDPSPVNGTASYTAGFTPAPRSYKVTVPAGGEGYTVRYTDSTSVPYGGTFSFTVEVEDGYDGENLTVTANGAPLPAQGGGRYQVTVTGDTVITVAGVEDNEGPALTAGWEAGESTGSFTEDDGAAAFSVNQAVTISIAAEDPSGVQSITYQLTGSAPVTVEGGTAVFEVGENFRGNLTVYATDWKGNAGAPSVFQEFCVELPPLAAPEVDAGGYDGAWTGNAVTLTPSADPISGVDHYEYSTDGVSWETLAGNSLTVSEEGPAAGYVFRVVSAAGNVSAASEAVTVRIDTTAPEGDVRFAGSSVKQPIGQISFNRFFRQDVDVEITGSDALSGVAGIAYYRSDRALTQDEVEAVTAWTQTDGGFRVAAVDQEQFICYVKITDRAGNVACFGSDGAVFDLTAPVIDGVTGGDTYYVSQIVTVSDANLSTVTRNGETVASPVTLVGDVESTYVVAARDMAGNETVVTVTMKPIASLKDAIEDLTADNVTSGDQEKIEAVRAAAEAVDTADALDSEKAALQAILDGCDALLEKIEQTADAIDSLKDRVSGYDADTVTSEDEEAIAQLRQEIQEFIDSGGLTAEEAAEMESAVSDLDEMLDEIASASEAGNTANTDKVEGIHSDNVTWEDKADLIAAKEDLEAALGEHGSHYTEEEKAQLQERLDQIGAAIESIEKAETAGDLIGSLPDTVQPDDSEKEAQILAAKEQYDALTEHEKDLLGETVREKLENLLAGLRAYRITAGSGSSWTLSSKSGLSFTANGAFGKFAGVKVDGKTVDPSFYTAVSGSTVITLKPEYLNTLSAGRHTLAITYTDGEAVGEFEILSLTVPDTPQTGDNGSAGLWAALMLVSACSLGGAAVCSRRRKYGE